jgi:hypothetical protein
MNSQTLIGSTAALLLLSTLGAAGCASSAETPERAMTADEALYGEGTLAKVWPNGIVPVCFNDTTANRDLQALIPDILARSWVAAANVTFTGFGACAVSGNQVTIVFKGGGFNGLTDNLGYGARTVTLVSDDTSTDKAHFQYEVIHEMGHALGFAHEMKRPDNWDGGAALQCAKPPTDPDSGQYDLANGGLYLTATYDSASIMNYCDPSGNRTTTLSAGDMIGARVAYPFASPLPPPPNACGISVACDGSVMVDCANQRYELVLQQEKNGAWTTVGDSYPLGSAYHVWFETAAGNLPEGKTGWYRVCSVGANRALGCTTPQLVTAPSLVACGHGPCVPISCTPNAGVQCGAVFWSASKVRRFNIHQ